MSRTGPRFQKRTDAPPRNKCVFCLTEATLSREHLFSVPICNTFGIDRAGLILSGDVTNRKHPLRTEALSTRKVKLPCASCNNGWMSNLETAAAEVFERYVHNNAELSADDVDVLDRWAAKSLVVLQWSDLDARKFMSSPGDGVLPDVTLARRVFDGSALDDVVFAVGRLSEPNPALWGAGNPTVVTADPEKLNCRVVNTVAFNLGCLQLWIIAPYFTPSQLKLPEGTVRLLPGTRFKALPLTSPSLDPDRVEAVFDRRTTTAIVRALGYGATRGDSLTEDSRPQGT